MPVVERAVAVLSENAFAEAGILSFLVVGGVAFLLGIAVTIFCLRLRKWREIEMSRKEDEK